MILHFWSIEFESARELLGLLTGVWEGEKREYQFPKSGLVFTFSAHGSRKELRMYALVVDARAQLARPTHTHVPPLPALSGNASWATCPLGQREWRRSTDTRSPCPSQNTHTHSPSLLKKKKTESVVLKRKNKIFDSKIQTISKMAFKVSSCSATKTHMCTYVRIGRISWCGFEFLTSSIFPVELLLH